MKKPVIGRQESRLKVRTLNVGAGKTAAKLADLNLFATDGTDVILGQEFGDRLDLVTLFLAANPTWRALWETQDNNHRKTPILYNSATLRLRWWEQVVAFLGGGWLGKQGKGPDRAETKRLNKARFVLSNGRRVKVLNHHMVVSAFSTTGGERERRQNAWEIQARAFFAEALATTIPVVGGGDWNASTGNPLLAKCQRDCPDWVWDSTGPTKESATIDLLGHRDDVRIQAVATGVDETDGSLHHADHRSPWVEYAVAGRKRR